MIQDFAIGENLRTDEVQLQLKIWQANKSWSDRMNSCNFKQFVFLNGSSRLKIEKEHSIMDYGENCRNRYGIMVLLKLSNKSHALA